MKKRLPLYSFWSWNGKLEESELRRQIREMKEQGYSGFFMHARAGLGVGYLSEEWFRAVDVSLDEAKSCGMEVGIYDENGWPSGFAGGKVVAKNPKLCQKYLGFTADRSVSGILAGYKRSGKNSWQRCALSEAQLFAHVIENPAYVDFLEPKTVSAFIECTHEEYKKRYAAEFGKTIRYVFSDEPQLPQLPWNDRLKEDFAREYGEDILDGLWRLNEDGADFDLFLYRYFALVFRAFRQNYTEKIAAWCAENRLEFTGHFAGEDSLTTFNVHGGVQNHYKSMQVPGIDFLGRRLAPAPLVKQAASVKNQFGKPHVLSESFGCTGWNTTFEEFLYIWNYQAAMGIDFPCLHLSAYSMKGLRKRDYPSFFSYQQPWWGKFSELTRRIKRINGFLQGPSAADVLVISAETTAQGVRRDGLLSRRIASSYRSLVEGLLAAQIAFDISNESILNEYGHIERGALAIGRARYKTVIFSAGLAIRKQTAKLLKRLSAAGINIAFAECLPTYFVEPFSKCKICYPVIFTGKKVLQKYFESIKYKRKIEFIRNFDHLLDGDLIVNSFRNGFAVLNQSCDAGKELFCRVGDAEHLFEYLPQTDTFVPAMPAGGNSVIRFAPMELKLFAYKKEKAIAAGERAACRIVKRPIAIGRGEKNILTIDRARYIADGKTSEEMPVIFIEDELIKKGASSFSVQYTFSVREYTGSLALYCEAEHCKITVNGSPVERSDEWLMDRCIKKYDISSVYREGVNTVTVFYDKVLSQPVGIDSDQETVRNIFVYNAEIENIYLCGDFSVRAGGKVTDCGYYLKVENPAFEIGLPEECKATESSLTAQGLWFYRGGVDLQYGRCVSEKGKKVYLSLREMDYAVACVFADGREIGRLLTRSDRLDITRYRNSRIALRIILSNRNTLGPMHHVLGEPNFVGERVFRGVHGFEDELMPSRFTQNTWTDAYNFVKNPIPELCLEYADPCGGEDE